MEHSPERELKLAATPDFRMPSVYGLVGPIVRQAPPERNDTTYYDTADLRLARWGASLRHRPGEGWTVKLPAERDSPYLVRPEIVFEGNGASPPAAALELVRSFVRHEDVHESVRMTTIRRRTGLHDTDGRLIAGVVDDAVSVINGGGPSSFRELEVEIGEEMTPGLLDALVERLRLAGAGAPDQTAKYIRALASPSSAASRDLGRRPRGGRNGRRCRAARDRPLRDSADPARPRRPDRRRSRRRPSDTRRDTSAAFRPAHVPSAPRPQTGRRDCATSSDGSRASSATCATATCSSSGCGGGQMSFRPGEQAAAERVLTTLQQSRDGAHAELLETLRSDRYVALLDRLVEAASAPGFLPSAGEPAGEAIPKLVRRPWHRLAKRAKALGDEPSNEQLHEVRIRTKRVRYAAEAAAPIVGRPARVLCACRVLPPGRAGRPERLGRRCGLARRLGRSSRRRRGGARRSITGRAGAIGRARTATTLACRIGRALGTRASRLDVTRTVLAAGGLVRRRREDGVEEILVVHRPAYDDWSFPKGKLEAGESEEDAAVREVEEETGLRCRLERELATTSYRDARRRPKTVRYWVMTPISGELGAANEIDDARFVPIAEARSLLTYARDVELLELLEDTE